MAAVLQKLLDSMSPEQLAIVQSATDTRDIISGFSRETSKIAIESYSNEGTAMEKRKNTSIKTGKVKTTRPLNSFMAFRCYYAVLFDDFEQKLISGYIVFLWERDPCKAKWALVAKAYSVIRDHVGKEHAPLDVFLFLVSSFLGLIEPQYYLAAMGWEISVNEIGSVSLMKDEKMEIDNSMLCTNVSVEDIVAYACQHGYARITGSSAAVPSNQPLMAMAASAQLHSGKNVENKGGVDHHMIPQDAKVPTVSGTTTASSNLSHAGFQGAGNNYRIPISPLSSGFECFANLNTAPTDLAQQRTNSNSQVTVAANTSWPMTVINATPPMTTINTTPPMVTTNAMEYTNYFHMSNIMDFDPEANSAIFDPNAGDKWDAFDISAWVNPDAYTD
ncbi:MAG: hypothetical protein Q9170_001902 [Blastenia crenularia]